MDTLALRGEPRPPRPFIPPSFPRRSSGKDCDSSLRTHTGARLFREQRVSLSSRRGQGPSLLPTAFQLVPAGRVVHSDGAHHQQHRVPSCKDTTLLGRSPPPSSFLSLWLSSVPCARIAAQCFGDGREFGSLHHIRSLCRGGLVVTRWLVFSAQRGLDSLSIVPLPGRSRCRRLDSRVGSLRSRTEQEEGGRGTIESRARALHFPSSITRAAYARDHHLEGFKREEGEGGGPIG